MSVIRAQGLKRSYEKGGKTIEVLRGIDVEFAPGDTVSIVGASGAGKSTFLNILGALDRPSAGELFFDDKPLFSFDDARLAAFRNSSVGFVFQFHHLLPEFTALENVMLPALVGGEDKVKARKRAEELLGEVGLSERLEHRPGELSGGEQQRCAIVRALSRTPRIVLADEPTGNLDKKTGEDVFELLLKLNKEHGTTFVMVTHNETLAGMMQRRLRMSDGNITELGSSEA